MFQILKNIFHFKSQFLTISGEREKKIGKWKESLNSNIGYSYDVSSIQRVFLEMNIVVWIFPQGGKLIDLFETKTFLTFCQNCCYLSICTPTYRPIYLPIYHLLLNSLDVSCRHYDTLPLNTSASILTYHNATVTPKMINSNSII